MALQSIRWRLPGERDPAAHLISRINRLRYLTVRRSAMKLALVKKVLAGAAAMYGPTCPVSGQSQEVLLAPVGRLAFGGRFASDGFGVASALRSMSAKVLADCAGGVL
jgi:hypothetical protein